MFKVVIVIISCAIWLTVGFFLGLDYERRRVASYQGLSITQCSDRLTFEPDSAHRRYSIPNTTVDSGGTSTTTTMLLCSDGKKTWPARIDVMCYIGDRDK